MSNYTFTIPEVDAPCWRPFVLAVTACRSVELRHGVERVIAAHPMGSGLWLVEDENGITWRWSTPNQVLASVAVCIDALPSIKHELVAFARARGVEEPVGREAA